MFIILAAINMSVMNLTGTWKWTSHRSKFFTVHLTRKYHTKL